MKLKQICSLAMVGVVAVAALAGCGSASSGAGQTGDVIKIGGIAPLTGDVAVYGNAAKNGAQLAIDQYNANGGVLGKQIQYIVLDDKGDPTEAVNAYNKLVSSEKVSAIIGAVTSKPTLTIAPLAAKEGIPVVTPTATALEVTEAGANIFRACYTDPYQGKVMGDFAAEKLSAKTAAVMYNTADDYSVGLAEVFKESFEAHGQQVVSFEGYTGGDRDFKAILTNINGKAPDVLFIADYYNTVGLITQQAQEVGIQAAMLGADGWDGVLEVAPPEAVEGAYFSNHYSADDQAAEVQNFLADYRAKYNEEPNALAALGYDAAVLMLEAIKTAGSVDKAAVVKALQASNVTTVTGTITFDENRNPVKSIAIIQVKDGQYTMFDKMNP